MHLHIVLVCVLCTSVRCLTLVNSAVVVRQPGNDCPPMPPQRNTILRPFAFLFMQFQHHRVHADARSNVYVTPCADKRHFTKATSADKLQTQFTALILNSALILHSCCSHVACGLQDRLLQEQQKSEQLQSQLASVQASHQQAAAAAGSQLAATQEALSQLEQEATEKLGQADMAAAEAEGQVDELTHDLEEARDAVKVISMQRTRHVIRLSCESHDWQQAAS